jgi:endonuclease YncB( thermonuclease family)
MARLAGSPDTAADGWVNRLVTSRIALVGWVVVGLVAVGTIAFLVYDHATTAPGDNPKPTTALVESVTDGDTLRLANGEVVRLVGIDAPERGVCGYDEAAALLTRLTLGERVTLSSPVRDRDRYDRLLRYVDVAGKDAGGELIRRGLAVARYDSRDGYEHHARQDAYIKLDRATPDIGCGVD